MKALKNKSAQIKIDLKIQNHNKLIRTKINYKSLILLNYRLDQWNNLIFRIKNSKLEYFHILNRHTDVTSNNSTVHLLCSDAAQTLAPLNMVCPSHRYSGPCIWLKWHRALLPWLPGSCDVNLHWLRSIQMCQTLTTSIKILNARHKQKIDTYRGPAVRFSSKDLEEIPVTKQKLWQQESRQNGTIFTQMRLLCSPDQSI